MNKHIFRFAALIAVLMIGVGYTQSLVPAEPEHSPELHLYTPDGKPRPDWDLPDFIEHWHSSSDLTPEWSAKNLPLVAHYRVTDGWEYSSLTFSPREFRKAYRASLGIKTPGQKTLVWIHAEACLPCKQMAIFLPEVSKLIPLEEHLWNWEDESVAGLPVRSVPLTTLMDADCKILQQWSGYVDFTTLKHSIETE